MQAGPVLHLLLKLGQLLCQGHHAPCCQFQDGLPVQRIALCHGE